MKKVTLLVVLLSLSVSRLVADQDVPASAGSFALASKSLASGPGAIAFDGLFYETEKSRVTIPVSLGDVTRRAEKEIKMPDGRTLKIAVKPDDGDFLVTFSAKPDADI